MRQTRTIASGWGILIFLFPLSLSAIEYESLEQSLQQRLLAGEVVSFAKRPDESKEVDKRFLTLARLLEGSQREIWEVIHDKEDAEKFIDGVLESKVVESSEDEILVDQKTHVGGPKGSYRYRLRHTLTPFSRSDFEFVSGEIRNVLGSWWILAGPDEKRCLVIYSLHIDPGVFAPQIIVKRGMRKTMPDTLQAMQDEVLRRREYEGNETQ